MEYAAFDRTARVAVLAALVLSVIASVALGSFSVLGLVIQVLIAAVAMATSSFGRRGGSAAAIGASVIYMLIRASMMNASALPSASVLEMVWPILAFGLVGIAGGQVLTAWKYDRKRLAEKGALDEWSLLFNEHHFSGLLTEARSRFESAGEPCCVIRLKVDGTSVTDHRPARQRLLARTIGEQLVSTVRLVDDCARLDDGSFAALIRNCERSSAIGAGDGLAASIRKQLRIPPDAVSITCIGLPDDETAFAVLATQHTA